jgi:hypothetical protein
MKRIGMEVVCFDILTRSSDGFEYLSPAGPFPRQGKWARASYGVSRW